MSAYTEASKAVFAVFDDTAPLVEGMSIDEAFLDVRGLDQISGSPAEIAARLRGRVRERVGLRSRSGSRARSSWPRSPAGSASPMDCWSCRPSVSSSFCIPCRSRAVGRRPGDRRQAAPARYHDRRLGGAHSRRALVSMLGRAAGRHLDALANNLDPRPVDVGRRRRSIGSQCALGPAQVPGASWRAVDRARRPGLAAVTVGPSGCRTVVLRLGFDDFSRVTRSHTLGEATGSYGDDSTNRQRAAQGFDAADRAPGTDADRDRAHQPVRPGRHPAHVAVQPLCAISMRSWIACGIGSAPRRSRAARWSATTQGCWCCCCPTST